MCICCGEFKNAEEISFCNFCNPDTCYNCQSSDVYIDKDSNCLDDIYVKCSHGCSLNIMEYINKKHFTVFLNGKTKNKVRLLGKIIEIIIPQNTSIRVVEQKPKNITEKIVGVHHTNNKKEILEEGFNYSLAEEDRIPIRNKAAYAYTNEQKIDTREKVYFIIPKNKSRISSQRILNFIGKKENQFPKEKYEELIITPEELKQNIKYNPFYTEKDLLY